MPVDIVDETGRAAALVDAALAASDAILAILGCGRCELSVALVGDERMHELNLQWRGIDRTTDVLSFSQLEGNEDAADAVMLGDVIVSVDTLRRQAAEGGWTEAEELVRLLLHGVLHLLGFDHEEAGEAERMRTEEGRVVAALAARDIACAWEGAS